MSRSIGGQSQCLVSRVCLTSRAALLMALVVACGEMGRTPKFTNRGTNDGRDHWSYCFPAILAGAGVQGGTMQEFQTKRSNLSG